MEEHHSPRPQDQNKTTNNRMHKPTAMEMETNHPWSGDQTTETKYGNTTETEAKP